MAKEHAKISRLKGAVLAELGRPEEETLVLASRMLQLGRAVRERLESAREDEVTKAPLISEIPLTMMEMKLELPFAEILRIYAVDSVGRVIAYGASYYVRGRVTGGYYLSDELGEILPEQLRMKPSEAAESLVYPTPLIENEKAWQSLLNSVSAATTEWGMPER